MHGLCNLSRRLLRDAIPERHKIALGSYFESYNRFYPERVKRAFADAVNEVSFPGSAKDTGGSSPFSLQLHVPRPAAG